MRSRFYLSGNSDLTPIGALLNELSRLRTRADYEMATHYFRTKSRAAQAVTDAENGLKLLAALEADPAKLAAAVAAIQSRFP